MSENLYSEIAYPTVAHLQTHPDRLAAVGTLFGMSPAPVRSCRVLEIGCGDGGNLIPMAYAIPESRFTGVDLADAPIARGCRTIAALGLPNASLIHADLRDISSTYGEFDYILAQGVYSWVPEDVRDRLLAVCAERLAPQGIAYVSYNAYPGRHFRQMLREMMLYHTRNLSDSAQRIEQSRGFLKSLLDGRVLNAPWRTLLDYEVTALLERRPEGLFHDDIAEINEPVYFWQFVEHASRHGLQYLSEADPSEAFDHQGSLAWLGDKVLEREQYLDFLRARSFRQTLLCRDGIPLRRAPNPEDLRRLLFSAPCKIVEEGQIQGLRGVRLASPHPAIERIASALGEAYPRPLAFQRLVACAGSQAAAQKILLGLVTSGFADIHLFDFPCQATVTAKPRTGDLVRHQATESRFVVNSRHQVVELDEVGRQLVLLMNGTRNHEELARDLAVTPNAPSLEKVREHLPRSLTWLAGKALLEA